MAGMFTTKEDRKQFDKWTKEQVYEAYLSEYKERVKLNAEVNRLNRLIAEIKYKCTK